MVVPATLAGVLVWAPKGRNASLARALLDRSSVPNRVCTTVDELCERVDADTGCVVVTDEDLTEATAEQISLTLEQQPPWSDLPFIVFRNNGPSRPQLTDLAEKLGNVTLLERPAKARAFISAVRVALRARGRQFQARDAIRHRDQFLAMLGHELRNPLSAIVLAADVLRREQRDSPQRLIIERQAKHLTRLVDDLLDVSRVTSDKISLQRSLVELNEVVGRSIQSAEATARARSQTLLFSPSTEPTRVCGDPARLEQVFTNLIHNAMKYSPAHSEVHVSVTTTDTLCVVVVADSGFGIDAEMLPRIFDLFTQASDSMERSEGGLGIGLTLVKRLVELHDGTVEATSAGLGLGSTFSVTLPRVNHPAACVEAARASEPRLDHVLRVVLIEDNEDIRELSQQLLEVLGCKVEARSDGPSGLDAIVEGKPDLALVDIGLPMLDGFEVARRVRASLGPGMTLIAITGYGQPEDRRRALEAGFDDHVTKPVSAQVLREVIARAARRTIS